MRTSTASALIVLSLAAQPVAAEPAAHAYLDLPITQTVNRDGVVRYAVWIKVGDRSVQAMVDTGSTGLRVLPNVVPGDFMGIHTDIAFGAGLHMEGLATIMSIGVGSVEGAAPLEVIDHIACLKDHPDCDVTKLSGDTYLIGGDGFPTQGYPAILGIRLPSKGNDIDNPFIALGIKRWIITLPRPFDREPGHLILDPSETVRDGFNVLARNGSADAWGCIQADALPERKCGTVLFDTGAPIINVSYDGLKEIQRWKTGGTGILEFAGKSNAFSLPFEVGQNGGLVAAISSPPQVSSMPETFILAGVTPFFAYDILYDAKTLSVALRPRPEVAVPSQEAQKATYVAEGDPSEPPKKTR